MSHRKAFQLGLLTSIAASVLACSPGSTYYRQCVDDTGRVVPDNNCNPAVTPNWWQRYRWYYRTGGYVPNGWATWGGSTNDPGADANIVGSSGVVRGTVGGTAAAHGGDGAGE